MILVKMLKVILTANQVNLKMMGNSSKNLDFKPFSLHESTIIYTLCKKLYENDLSLNLRFVH